MGPDTFELLMKFRALGIAPPRTWKSWRNRQGFNPWEIELARKNWTTIRALLNPISGPKFKIRADDEEWLNGTMRILDTEYRLATRVWKKKIPPGEPARYLLAKIAYLHGLLPADWEINLNEFLPRIKRI